MSDRVESFLANNTLAGSIALQARIRVARADLSAAQVAEARSIGRITARPLPKAELVVGEVILAVGRIVEEEGRSFFEVEDVR